MGEYLKIADCFEMPLSATETNSGRYTMIDSCCGIVSCEFDCDAEIEVVLHAINYHDEIVENMQHYKQESEQWEARATKEASRVQDLEAEVERLTKSAELAIMTLEEVDRVLTERIKNGAYDLDDISGEVTYTLDRLSHRE